MHIFKIYAEILHPTHIPTVVQDWPFFSMVLLSLIIKTFSIYAKLVDKAYFNLHFLKLNANFIKDFQLHISNFLNGTEPFWNWKDGIDEHWYIWNPKLIKKTISLKTTSPFARWNSIHFLTLAIAIT